MPGATACPACGSATAVPSYLGDVRFESFAYRYLACGACGSLYADPMPGPEVLARIYAPAYAATHYAAELDGESSNQELVREIAGVLKLLSLQKPAARMLDIGCGAGRFMVLAREAGFRVEGHELMAASAEVAARGTGLRVHAGPLASLSGGYDAIHLADVLEHSPRPIGLLREAVSLLAPEGVVLLRGPLENQVNLFQRVMRLRRQVLGRLRPPPPTEMPPYHVNLFTLAGWRALTSSASLVSISERVYEIHWPAPERFAPTLVSATKAASLLLTATPLGHRLALGNRVVTFLRRT